MIDLDADVLVIGGGFGGSLAALVLQRIGLKPVVVERGRHPRFVLGESSTPLADLALSQLARRYDLPRLAPLAKYGTWQATYPELPCGLKRGFSYFKHHAGRTFAPDEHHSTELIVAASPNNTTADTHWYRPDFDQFLFQEAQAAGIPCLEGVELGAIQRAGEGSPADGGWLVSGRQGDEPLRVQARFLLDASGDGCVLARALGISTDPRNVRTRSRALFAHFTGVRPWHDIVREAGGRVADHPFPCDDAALHHILDGGWMYVLRFNNGVTSAGFLLDLDVHPPRPGLSADDEWQALMSRYPSLAGQFAEAQIVAPAGGLRKSGRLQRRAEQVVGPGWAMLPTTAGIFDAMHSTGNVDTLYGIERLCRILEEHWRAPRLADALAEHARLLHAELDLIDTLVRGCYLAFDRLPLMADYCMWYFAAATQSEQRRRLGTGSEDAFLQAHNPDFRQAVERAYLRLTSLVAAGPLAPSDLAEHRRQTAQDLAPFNIAELCDDRRRHMYPFPATCQVAES